jgi:hypothetical protein
LLRLGLDSAQMALHVVIQERVHDGMRLATFLTPEFDELA